MSDYLSGLAARVVAPPGSMHPRRASRFEPGVASAIELPETGDRTWTSGERREPNTTRPRPPGRLSASDEQSAMRGEDTDAAGDPPPVPRPQEETHSTPAREVRVEEPARRQPALTRSAPPDDATVPPTPSSLAIDDFATGGETPRRASAAPRTRAVVRERTVASAIERLRQRREQTGVDRETVAAPIEITIGRIDVRAVVAPQSQRPQPKPGPRVSTLEEYAARRGGGRK